MSLFAKRAVAAAVPRHVEIWGELEENNRFLRILAAACAAWAFLGLGLGAYGLSMALYRPLAFHVDGEGTATFVGRLREQVPPSPPEVRHVAKQFLERYIAFNSLTIESDLAQAWNLMTSELRVQQERVLEDYRKEHGGAPFVSAIKEQGIQTSLEFDPKQIQTSEHAGKVWSVRLRGEARTWPLNRVGEDAAESRREFEAMVTLVRVPRTEQTPNGLLVAKVSNRFFVNAADGIEPKRTEER